MSASTKANESAITTSDATTSEATIAPALATPAPVVMPDLPILSGPMLAYAAAIADTAPKSEEDKSKDKMYADLWAAIDAAAPTFGSMAVVTAEMVLQYAPKSAAAKDWAKGRSGLRHYLINDSGLPLFAPSAQKSAVSAAANKTGILIVRVPRKNLKGSAESGADADAQAAYLATVEEYLRTARQYATAVQSGAAAEVVTAAANAYIAAKSALDAANANPETEEYRKPEETPAAKSEETPAAKSEETPAEETPAAK